MPKKSTTPSIQRVVDEKVKAWESWLQSKPKGSKGKPVITISREAGAGGSIVAREVAGLLGFHVFDSELIQAVARSAHMREEVIKTLDERENKLMDNWILAFFTDRYLWPDQFIKHLARVLFSIGQRGDAVIVGRGANFLIPLDECFRLRVVAPLDKRIPEMAERYSVSEDEAGKLIRRQENDRRAFVMQHFGAEVADPVHYDMVLNTGGLSYRDAAQMVKAAIKIRFKYKKD